MALTVEKTDDKFVFHGCARNLTKAKNAALQPYDKCVTYHGLQLELLPTPEQAAAINQQIGNARFVANHYLSMRIAVYNAEKRTLSAAEYKKEHLPKLKEEYPFLIKSDKFALEAALSGVDSAYKKADV